MNKSYRPFGIYHSTPQEGVWIRRSSYRTMEIALQALGELTKTPREQREYRYIILPNQDDRRGILFKEEQAKHIYESAR